MNRAENEERPSITIEAFDKTPKSWKRIAQVIGDLNERAFSMPADQPLLGEKETTIAYKNLKRAFMSPETTVLIAAVNDELVGYTLAMPVNKMSPERKSEARQTAYIYFTAFIETMRGRRYVGELMDKLLKRLYDNGYKFVERDSVLAGGYADSIERHYGKYPKSIVEKYDHTKFPEIGPERFFRINIEEYLRQRFLNINDV